ncbi:jg19970 [Pararge aegeria aegeria]|uniref:Jg19970 protein n=1 Tax=Pararge aegeria aegeria TaxID=348720 RepID=A0A8S4S2Y7_9NEOP|nr:jg19970 [Pararge aegeria aegeria]
MWTDPSRVIGHPEEPNDDDDDDEARIEGYIMRHANGTKIASLKARISLVYILAVLPGLLPWGGGGGGAGAWFLSLCHLLGALAPWCGSFLYHLFMNHTQGASLYHKLLQLDMLGIWVSQSIVASYDNRRNKRGGDNIKFCSALTTRHVPRVQTDN